MTVLLLLTFEKQRDLQYGKLYFFVRQHCHPGQKGSGCTQRVRSYSIVPPFKLPFKCLLLAQMSYVLGYVYGD